MSSTTVPVLCPRTLYGEEIPLAGIVSVRSAVAAFATGQIPVRSMSDVTCVSILRFATTPDIPALQPFLDESYERYCYGENGPFVWNCGYVDGFPRLKSREITIRVLDRTITVFSLQVRDTIANNYRPTEVLADRLMVPRIVIGQEIVVPATHLIERADDNWGNAQTWVERHFFDLAKIINAFSPCVPQATLAPSQATADLVIATEPIEIVTMKDSTTIWAEPRGGKRWQKGANTLGMGITEVRRFPLLPFKRTVEPVLVLMMRLKEPIWHAQALRDFQCLRMRICQELGAAITPNKEGVHD